VVLVVPLGSWLLLTIAVPIAAFVSRRLSRRGAGARVTDPPDYHTLRHFITHAPWSAARMGRVLRAHLPERRGVLLLDDAGFPKKGRALGRRGAPVHGEFCPSAVAHRATGSTPENRTRPRPRRRAPLPGMGTPRGRQRCGLRLSATGTDAPRHAAHLRSGPRPRPRDRRRAALRLPPTVCRVAARGTTPAAPCDSDPSRVATPSAVRQGPAVGGHARSPCSSGASPSCDAPRADRHPEYVIGTASVPPRFPEALARCDNVGLIDVRGSQAGQAQRIFSG
jgi:hypothetical protein